MLWNDQLAVRAASSRSTGNDGCDDGGGGDWRQEAVRAAAGAMGLGVRKEGVRRVLPLPETLYLPSAYGFAEFQNSSTRQKNLLLSVNNQTLGKTKTLGKLYFCRVP